MSILVDGVQIDGDGGAPAPGPGWSTGHSWERAAPEAVVAGTVFVCSDDLSEQVSTGVAASPGVAASGWMQRLSTGLFAGRASLSVAPPRAYANAVNLSAYTIDNTTMAALFTWNGTQPASYGFSEVAMIGDRDNEGRGIHLVYVTNGANTDLAVCCNGTWTVLVPSANLLAGAVGLHAVVVAPVNVAGTHKWRFSYDGSAAADVTMAAAYVPPSAADAIALGSRPDGLVYLNGTGIELSLWNSLLSGANMAALATLPATPTYELPESAATGAATIRAQASRFDTTIGLLPMRGLATPLTVAVNVVKVTL